MSVCRGREVTVISSIHHKSIDPVYVTIQHKDGMKEKVRLSDVYFTKEEKRELMKNQVDDIKEISDSDLKALRDSQNPDKVKK